MDSLICKFDDWISFVASQDAEHSLSKLLNVYAIY